MRISFTLRCLMLAILLTMCLSSTSIIYADFDPELADTLQEVVNNNVVKYKLAGVTVAVTTPEQGIWAGAGGMADKEADIAMVPDNLLYIASITKTFVATTTLLLAEDGILTLEDSVEQWLPELVPNGDNITIRHLLSHTSGLFDYTNVWFDEAAEDNNRVWQPEELIAMATARPAVFAPGESYSYCNTGYALLGMIIEEATDSPVEQEIRQRLLEPLELNHTFLAVREEIPDGMTVARSSSAPDPYTSLASGAWTAGGMVSSAEDLAKWADALYGGAVLEQASLDDMLTFKSGYGLGVMQSTTPMGTGVGHIGGLTGYNSYMYHIPDTGVTVAAIDNGGGASLVAINILKRLLNPEAVNAVDKLFTNWGAIKQGR